MTGVRLHRLPLLFGVLVVGVAPALAQTLLTLEDAIKRAQGDTADARALASAIDEATTVANFAIPALNHPDPVTNTRTAVALEQRVFDSGLAHLGVQAATLEHEAASASRDAARLDLYFMSHQERHAAASSVVPSPAGALS